MNDVADRTNINPDDTFVNTLSNIQNDLKGGGLAENGINSINANIDNILSAVNDQGVIPGDAYQALTRTGAPLQRAQSSLDPNTKYYANQVRDALDDAFQRSAAPEDQAALATARYQYRNMKTIQDLVANSPDGQISPAQLLAKVRGASNRFDGSTSGMAYTGGGDLGELANIGQAFLKSPPDSGTASRMLVNHGIQVAAGLGASGVGVASGVVPGLLTAGGGLMANRLANTYMRSGMLANKVIKNSLPVAPAANPLAYYGAPIASMVIRPQNPLAPQQ